MADQEFHPTRTQADEPLLPKLSRLAQYKRQITAEVGQQLEEKVFGEEVRQQREKMILFREKLDQTWQEFQENLERAAGNADYINQGRKIREQLEIIEDTVELYLSDIQAYGMSNAMDTQSAKHRQKVWDCVEKLEKHPGALAGFDQGWITTPGGYRHLRRWAKDAIQNNDRECHALIESVLDPFARLGRLCSQAGSEGFSRGSSCELQQLSKQMAEAQALFNKIETAQGLKDRDEVAWSLLKDVAAAAHEAARSDLIEPDQAGIETLPERRITALRVMLEQAKSQRLNDFWGSTAGRTARSALRLVEPDFDLCGSGGVDVSGPADKSARQFQHDIKTLREAPQAEVLKCVEALCERGALTQSEGARVKSKLAVLLWDAKPEEEPAADAATEKPPDENLQMADLLLELCVPDARQRSRLEERLDDHQRISIGQILFPLNEAWLKGVIGHNPGLLFADSDALSSYARRLAEVAESCAGLEEFEVFDPANAPHNFSSLDALEKTAKAAAILKQDIAAIEKEMSGGSNEDLPDSE